MRKKILTALLFMLTSLTAAANDTDSLQVYMLAAIQSNPAVSASYNRYKAQMEASTGAGQLPDPEFGMSIYPQAMHHSNSKQILTLSVMQMFPWFGTLKSVRMAQQWQAEAMYQRFREEGLSLVFDVQKQWYDILLTRQQLKSVRENLKTLKDIEQVALAQYRTALGMKNSRMSDQLRLQAEELRLQEQIESLRDKEKLQCRQLNLLMHRDADSKLVLPDSMSIRPFPVVDWGKLESASPRLQQLSAQEKMYRSQADAVRGQGFPRIGIGLEYMVNGKINIPVMPDMNGKNMVMPMLKVTLPIYRSKTRAGIKSAQLMQQSANDAYLRQQDELHAQYLSVEQRAEDAKRQASLYDNELKLLNQTLHLMVAEYANGTTSLTDILQTSRENIDYSLKKFEALARYNTIVAEYEKLASLHDYAVK